MTNRFNETSDNSLLALLADSHFPPSSAVAIAPPEDAVIRLLREHEDYICLSSEGMPAFFRENPAGQSLGAWIRNEDEAAMLRLMLNQCKDGEPRRLDYTVRGQSVGLTFRSLGNDPVTGEVREAEIRIGARIRRGSYSPLPIRARSVNTAQILSTIPVGVLVLNDQFSLKLVNEAACRCLRLTEEQLRRQSSPGFDWHMVRSNGTRFDLHKNEFVEALQMGHAIRDKLLGVWNHEARLYHWLMISGRVCQEVPERHYLLMMHDVTELIHSRERYRTITEHSLDAICITDGTRWVYLNQTGLDLFEADNPEDLLGMNTFDRIHPRYHGEVRDRMEQVLEDNRITVLHEEEWITLKGNRVVCEVLGVPVILYNKRMVKLIIRDITERKQSHERLLQSEKLNVAGQIAASVAHEIRNPLTSLKGFIKLMRKQGVDSRYLGIMETELERINGIAQELLYLGKPQLGERRRLPVRELLEQVVSLMESQAHMNSVSIDMEPGEEIFTVGDGNQLKQVLINLVKNAVEAMPQGGTVTVAARREPGFAALSIRDEGPGIPEELLDKLGSPFFSTKESGTGLGLMVCRNIIHEHQGMFQVESKTGAGTVFTVRLPLEEPDAAGQAVGP